MHALSHPTLCHPKASPGSSVHGILQARILEWVAVPFSRDLPDPGIKPASPALQVDSLPLSHWGKSRDCDAHQIFYFFPWCLSGPLPLGKTKWLLPSKKKRLGGNCDTGCFPSQAMKSLCGIPRFFLACQWTLTVFRKLSLVYQGLWVETWSRVPHPNIAKQTYV